MTIVSFPFFAFVAALVVVYFVMPKSWRWVALLAGSCAFYWLNSKWLLLVLLGTTLITYGLGLWIQRIRDDGAAYLQAHKAELTREMKREKKQATKRASRRVLTLGILVDLAPLLVMKYSGFFASSVNAMIGRLGSGTRLPVLNLLLPLGISFYTLQAIAYLVDIYRGKVQADRNPAKFMLFMSFFPQIVQGPIPRHSQLARQLYEGHDFDYDRLCKGMQLMVWGLFKKLVIGERIAIAVDYLFANYQSYTGLIVFMGVAMYGIQVYADFSGGMDIVRGVSQMLGIELELNFNQPYFSSSVEEFWRRWHITMGSWMRDYVFYPLSMSKGLTALGQKARKALGQYVGNRVGPFFAMFVVYILVGLWHGPRWSYVAFGLWNGVFIMLGILLDGVYAKAREKAGIREDAVTWRIFRVVRTFIVISFGRYFSRAEGLTIAVDMMKRTFVNWWDLSFITNGTLLKLELDTANWILLLACLLVLFYVDFIHEKGISFRTVIARQPLVFRWLIYIAAILAILIFGIYGPKYNAADFIYQGF